MKLGILGGSFNPPHFGHLAMATHASRAHGLDKVILMPAGNPPHKREGLAPAEHRLAMARLAVSGREGLEVSDLEVRRTGPSYTADTLEELRRLHPGAELFFILGDDSLRDLPGWRQPERILSLCRVVSVNRPGVETTSWPRSEDLPGTRSEVLERLERDRVEMPPCPLESSSVRAAIRERRSIRDAVPAAVAAYIEEHGLYQDG